MPTSKAFQSSRFIKTGPRIQSRSFDGHRVDVLLPEDLHPNSPVLIIHDGMNVFFKRYASTGHTWQITEGIESGRILGDPLVIAIWGEGGTKKFNPRRFNEFLCDDIFESRPELWGTLNPLLTLESREPRGNYFLTLVAEAILPAVLTEFEVEHNPKRTAIMGCSVAGVASIYSAAKRPEVFGAALGMSSHWEFGGEVLVRELAGMLRLKTGLKIWSDSGTLGLDQASQRLNSLFGRELQNIGLAEHQDFETPTFWGTGHSESFWARRVELPINFWLADTAGAT
jgi:predicted alpha/beta superfamily hydrolase